MDASELLAFFTSSRWRIIRQIQNHVTNESVWFEGSAAFVRQAKSTLYRESGFLKFDGKLIEMNQQYLFSTSGSQNLLEVRFKDGRPFHEINCKQFPVIQFTHQCGPDTYTGVQTIKNENWKTEWQVDGPKKQLLIVSEFEPITEYI